jgi:hypothetical protein
MTRTSFAALCALTLVFARFSAPTAAAERPSGAPSLEIYVDATGWIGALNAAGPTDRSNPFFKSLGTNGRSCATCHDARQAMSFTPAAARQRYLATRGRDPLFASIDGANCPKVQPADRTGHSLVLNHGLIRVAQPLPAAAEFSISVVRDPYGCALEVDAATGQLTVSVYRRPLPSANLRYLSAIMWDGRETVSPLADGATFKANLRADLMQQALDATLGHAQAAVAPTDAQLRAIVDFELAQTTAQSVDNRAGLLTAGMAHGGPAALARQPYYPGINDSLGADPSGAAFSPQAMRLFEAWQRSSTEPLTADARRARADIAAGERIFNTFKLTIANVRGFNDNDAIGRPASFVGTCTSCHDSPNVGNHSLPLPLDIGTSHTSLAGAESDPAIGAALATLHAPPDLPVFLVQGCPSPFAAGEPVSFYTSDPGRALTTGRCSDLDRIKGPVLRGLAARAPYFHNGAAATLDDVVRFYDRRFAMGLSDLEKRQLVAFLGAL